MKPLRVCAVTLGVLSCEKRRVRGERGRNRRHVVFEQNRLAGDGVEVGGFDPGIAVATKVVGPGGIERNNDYMTDSLVRPAEECVKDQRENHQAQDERRGDCERAARAVSWSIS